MQIPKLCATDMLDAFGSCRLCLVEIEGRAGTPASCTTPVAEGIVVKTQTERIKAIRRGVMELYISDHPLDCLTVGQRRLRITGHGRRGRLARRALRLRRRKSRLRQDGRRGEPELAAKGRVRIRISPSNRRNASFARAACAPARRRKALSRSPSPAAASTADVVAGMEEKFMTSECVSCGACVQACPTATLNEKKVIEIGKPEHSVVTTCAYCGVGCSFKAEMRGEELVRMVPYKDGKANRGHSCVKGRFAWGYATHRERMLKPMMRGQGHRSVEGSELGRGDRSLASEFKRIQEKYGKGSVGGITSSRCTNEETFLVQKLDARRLRQQQRRYLRAGVPFADRIWPRPDLRHVCRHAELRFSGTHRRHHCRRRQSEPMRTRFSPRGMKKRLRQGAKLIVIDPRRIEIVHMRARRRVLSPPRSCPAPTSRS